MSCVEPLEERDRKAAASVRTLSICLINPRFETSYWGFEYALSLYPDDMRQAGFHSAFIVDDNFIGDKKGNACRHWPMDWPCCGRSASHFGGMAH
jgi:hypothetical protein